MLSAYQIDSRPNMLEDPPAHWDETAREAAIVRQSHVREGLERQYGTAQRDQKAQDFKDLGSFPQSILGYHNRFLMEIRDAFVVGGYYPALTGAGSFGERLLNNMVIRLYSSFPKSRKYRKARSIALNGGCDDWNVLIDILKEWDVLLPEESYQDISYAAVSDQFRELKSLRDQAVHYNGEAIEANVRGEALRAIHVLQSILLRQFGLFAYQPWFMRNTPGVQFVAKNWEHRPFVCEFYLPNCLLVGPYHRVETRDGQMVIVDDYPYESIEVSDDEFRDALLLHRHPPSNGPH